MSSFRRHLWTCLYGRHLKNLKNKSKINQYPLLSILPRLNVVVSTKMHPIGLSSSNVLPTHLALNPRPVHVFGLNVVDHVGPLVADVATNCALEVTLSVLVEHFLNSLIEFFKWNDRSWYKIETFISIQSNWKYFGTKNVWSLITSV